MAVTIQETNDLMQRIYKVINEEVTDQDVLSEITPRLEEFKAKNGDIKSLHDLGAATEETFIKENYQVRDCFLPIARELSVSFGLDGNKFSFDKEFGILRSTVKITTDVNNSKPLAKAGIKYVLGKINDLDLAKAIRKDALSTLVKLTKKSLAGEDVTTAVLDGVICAAAFNKDELYPMLAKRIKKSFDFGSSNTPTKELMETIEDWWNVLPHFIRSVNLNSSRPKERLDQVVINSLELVPFYARTRQLKLDIIEAYVDRCLSVTGAMLEVDRLLVPLFEHPEFDAMTNASPRLLEAIRKANDKDHISMRYLCDGVCHTSSDLTPRFISFPSIQAFQARYMAGERMAAYPYPGPTCDIDFLKNRGSLVEFIVATNAAFRAIGFKEARLTIPDKSRQNHERYSLVRELCIAIAHQGYDFQISAMFDSTVVDEDRVRLTECMNRFLDDVEANYKGITGKNLHLDSFQQMRSSMKIDVFPYSPEGWKIKLLLD